MGLYTGLSTTAALTRKGMTVGSGMVRCRSLKERGDRCGIVGRDQLRFRRGAQLGARRLL